MKRLLAALLTISMMISVVPFSAFADSPGTTSAPGVSAAAQGDTSTPVLDEETVQAINTDPLLQGQYAPAQPQQTQTVVDTSDMTMEATDGFGKLLLNSIDEQNDLSGDERITDVTVDIASGTATVRYVSEQDADLVVALYTDDSEMTMAASGTVDAPAMLDNTGSASATVTLSGSIPSSFKVKAFLLDKDDHAPLCNEYVSSAYTKDIQDLDNATTADYPADRVLNLDDDTTTNFAVVNEDTVLVDANDASTGAMDITDNGDGSYTITNADERTKNLQPGENFVYQTDDDFIALRVENISQSGDTVTLSGNSDDLDLEDVFDVVKINNTADTDDFTFASPDGEPFPDLESENGFGDIDAGDTLKKKAVPIDHKSGSLSVTGTLQAVVGYHVKISYINHERYMSAYIDADFTGDLKISGSFNESFPIATIGVTSMGLYAGIKPTLEINAQAKLVVGLTVTTHNGFELSGGTFNNISDEPTITPILDAEGSLYIGINLNPEISAFWGQIGVHMDARVGATAAFELQKKDAEDPSLESLHTCDFCFSVTLTGSAELSVDVWFFSWKKDHEIYKGDLQMGEAYYSLTYDEFGWGKCPHRSYRVTINTTSGADAAYSITGASTQSGTLDSSGTATVFLASGSYTITVTVGGNEYSQAFTVDTNALTVNVKTESSWGGEASGTCGNNLTWKLDGEGTLTIRGTGSMDNYSATYDNDTKITTVDSPWFEHKLDIERIVIQSGVTSIGKCAFDFCSNVVSVSIPSTVNRIGAGAFGQCDSLTSVVIPYGVTSIPDAAFFNCDSLTSVVLPNSITSIGMMAFEDCTNLSDITIPDSVTSIGWYAFESCSSLTDIVLPDGLTNLGAGAFANCTGLTSIEIPRKITDISYELFGGCTNLTNVSIPDTVTTIGEYAFSDCTSLTSIRIPSSVTTIGESAFSDCTSLTSIRIPSSVTSIGRGAFSNCSNLTSFEIPNGVTQITDYTFRNCTSLTSVTVPASVTKIGYSAFENCFSLTTVNYAGTQSQWAQIDIDSSNDPLEKAYAGTPVSSCGDNLTWKLKDGTLTISGTGEMTSTPWRNYVTYDLGPITSVVLENGVTSIDSFAFEYKDLTSVTLPVTLTSIDFCAFDGCTITVVYYAGSPEQWGNIKIRSGNDPLIDATKYYYYNDTYTFSDEENGISYSTPDTTGNAHEFTASFTGLTSGVSYSVIVSKSSIDPLAPENLIYINQFRASSEDKQVTFRTRNSSTVTANEMSYVAASGLYAFEDTPVNPGGSDSGSGGSGGGGGGGGGGGAAVIIGVGVAAAVTAGIILTMPVDVQGRAELADHTALPGAKVSLLQDGNVVVQTTADENGNFALKAKRGNYELTVAYTDANGQLIHKTTSIKAPAKDLVITF